VAFRRAISLHRNLPEAYNNLGIALKDTGQLEEAIDAYRQAIALKPNYPEAHSNAGNALREKGKADQAIAAYRAAIALRPNYPEAYNNLGNALKDNGQLDEAIAAYRRAIALKPNFAKAYSNLGNALSDKARPDEAIAACRAAIALQPDLAEAYSNLGIALRDKGQPEEAIAAYRQAISLKPNLAEAHSNMGIAFWAAGQLDEAIAACRAALAIQPNLSEAYNNLGLVLKDGGLLEEAIAAFRHAIALDPNLAGGHDNLLYCMHFHPDYDAQRIAQEHSRWNRQHAEPLKQFIGPHRDERNRDRRMRIGYVSPDLRQHSVAYFLENLLAHHDASSVEVFCYSDVTRPDATTARMQKLCAQWRDIVGLKDTEVDQKVREDRIDILVDLAGHTANNRLLLFARKPAPIQVTYLGYPDTTGLRAMDYRLTDAYADPPDVTGGYSEELVRLPDTFLCYRPSYCAPAIGPARALEIGRVTFGSFNALAKVNTPLLAMWSKILEQIPNSRLILKNQGLGSAGARGHILEYFAAHHIAPDRVELMGWARSEAEHLQLYNRIDIALDTFPYHGTTTSCEALWMGVPVVTRAGSAHVSRVGVSLLSNVGLAELVADSQEKYVQLAGELAHDLSRLSNLRSTLRKRMERSLLMDAPRFARNVESAYRQMWQRWCETLGEHR
jgi:predicted O-linked N-acetylglucosamine transferase (SPINDLY family)